MTIQVRPQPIGYFPFPAGLLLLSNTSSDHAGALKNLLLGEIPEVFPDEWRYFFLALRGERAAAFELLEADESPLGSYNRFVLSGDPELLEQLEAQGDALILALARAVAYTLGLSDFSPDPGSADGELRAMLAMVGAAHAIEKKQTNQAVELLTTGIDASAQSPLLAAHLLDQRAQLRREQQSGGLAMQDWHQALCLAANTHLPELLAHLHLSLGSAFHESANGQRGPLEQAAKHYQQALSNGYSLEQNPEMFAWTQQQLAVTYLAMPLQSASDPLRMAIAVQSLREALKVYTKETHLQLWTVTQLNLANALQYLPSAHPKENLVQAVEIYEQLLPFRERAFDPVGYARLLFNQANALAHLGVFQPALEKLNEAHKLFHWHDERSLAASALEQVAHINELIASQTPLKSGVADRISTKSNILIFF